MQDTGPKTGYAAAEAASLEALLLATGAGDRAALRAIYEQEAPRMLGVAMRILRRRALAEEAVQDAFVQIWRHAASFDPARGTGETWLYAVVRNRSLSMLRSEQRMETSEAPLDETVIDETEGPEQAVMRLSENDALRRCLERLEPRRRHAIALAFVHGLTHAELAGRLGMPLGTVKSWLRRSLMALKECLQ